MQFNAKEITANLEKQLENLEFKPEKVGVGTVITIGDGVAQVSGLDNVKMGEMVEFPGGTFGMAINLGQDTVGCILFDHGKQIKEGDTVKSTGRIMSVPAGDALAGRVVNVLGQPVDGKGPINTDKMMPLERKAEGVMYRKGVNTPLQTGIKAIDAMIPIGRGQRELIIGDRQLGKTAIAVDTIINQKGQNVRCFYVAIGQKQSTVANVVNKLQQMGAMEYTTIIVATASDPAAMNYIAPYTGCAMAEEVMYSGKDALVIYDDLSKHAWAYREISLLLRRPPGREAYPGDIFYLHSRLLERSSRLSDSLGGGSLTALPLIETQAGDVSAYIPTNVISITDGQIFLESEMFYAGKRPSINPGISVSRVGGSAQVPIMKKVAGNLRLSLAQFRELESFAQIGSDLDPQTKATLNRGQRVVEVLKQPQYQPLPVSKQIAIIYAVNAGLLDDVELKDVRDFENKLYVFMDAKHKDLMETLAVSKKFTPEIEEQLKGMIKDFKEGWKK
ncbi:F0F1 ATP synthase subunit alpha [Candidatus Gracilibacteria bacterium]|nr:F0F1 ATP synthase subunit alpha [Candidatus Gracilibacteria bacterium]